MGTGRKSFLEPLRPREGRESLTHGSWLVLEVLEHPPTRSVTLSTLHPPLGLSLRICKMKHAAQISGFPFFFFFFERQARVRNALLMTQ